MEPGPPDRHPPSTSAPFGSSVESPSGGGTQITGQRIQVGLRHAGRIVTIDVADTTLRVLDERDELITTIPRTSHREVTRHKAYSHTANRNTG